MAKFREMPIVDSTYPTTEDVSPSRNGPFVTFALLLIAGLIASVDIGLRRLAQTGFERPFMIADAVGLSLVLMVGPVLLGPLADRLGGRRMVCSALFVWSLLELVVMGVRDAPTVVALDLLAASTNLGVVLGFNLVLKRSFARTALALPLVAVVEISLACEVVAEKSEHLLAPARSGALLGGAGIGLLVCALWWFGLRRSEGGRPMSRRRSGRETFGLLLRRDMLGLLFVKACAVALFYIALYLLYDYMVQARSVAAADVQRLRLVAVAAALVGAYASDRLFRARGTLRRGRMPFIIAGFALCLPFGVMGLMPDWGLPTLAAVVLAGVGLLGQTNVLVLDVAPGTGTGAFLGLVIGLDALTAFVTLLLSGILRGMTGSYGSSLVFAAIIALVGLLASVFLVRRLSPLDDSGVGDTAAIASVF